MFIFSTKTERTESVELKNDRLKTETHKIPWTQESIQKDGVQASTVVSSSFAPPPIKSFRFFTCRSSRFLRCSRFFTRRASAWSLQQETTNHSKFSTGMKKKNWEENNWAYESCLDLTFSAFFLWINSIRTRLLRKTLPLTLRYRLW